MYFASRAITMQKDFHVYFWKPCRMVRQLFRPIGAGIPAMVDSEFGILVPTQSPLAIADALECLSRDRTKLREMGQAARRKYASKYTLSLFQETLIDLLVDPKRYYEAHAMQREQTSHSHELTSQNG